MHNHERTNGALPPAAVRGPDGRPLLSWRVLLLPYIEEDGEPVPWTKPDELAYDPDEPLPPLGGILRDGRFRAAMADGSVRHFEVKDEDRIRAAVTGQPEGEAP